MAPYPHRFATSRLREFRIPNLHRFTTSGLRRFKIPDLHRFLTSGLCRFKILDLDWFATSGLCRFKISDLHRVNHPENSFREFRQTRHFEGERFFLNSPTVDNFDLLCPDIFSFAGREVVWCLREGEKKEQGHETSCCLS
jgi:hypothetical protein